MNDLTEMLKGTLEGGVLEIIDSEETYGYAVTRQLNAPARTATSADQDRPS